MMKFLVVLYFEMVQKGVTVKLEQLYSGIYSHPQLREACERLGFTSSKPIEEKWKNEIRYGVWEARKQGLIKHVGTQRSGEWQRI
jgi:hypothetical protein